MNNFFILLSFLFTFNFVHGQSIEIADIPYRSDFAGLFPITNNQTDQVEGYYSYYLKNMEKKGMQIMEFVLLNKDLSTTTKTELKIHRLAEINRVVNNGKYFLISYNDLKNQKIVAQTISFDGEIVGSREIHIDPIE